MKIYLFDLDGTLTPSRLPMREDFAKRFLPWMKDKKTFIAAGSDYKKIEEQLPKEVLNAFSGIYSAMGNVLTIKNQTVYQNYFSAPESLIQLLEKYVQNTKYPLKLFPNHVEERIGMLNFSVLGRNCPHEERIKYAEWDKTTHERENIAQELRQLFPDYEISIGGSISIDITPRGFGKDQIARHLRRTYKDSEILFFGNKTMKGGNDYSLAHTLSNMPNTKIFQINKDDDVLDILGI